MGLESPFFPRMLSTVAALSSEDTGESAALGIAVRGHTVESSSTHLCVLVQACLLAEGTWNAESQPCSLLGPCH